MKEVRHYVCDTCGTEYGDKKKCRECEEGHREPAGIDGAVWHPITADASGYPAKVRVKMDNGEVVTYRR